MNLEEGFAFIDLLKQNEYNNSEQFFLRGVKTSKITKGVASFNSAYIVGNPNTSVVLVVISDLTPFFNKDLLQTNNFQTFNEKTNRYEFLIVVKLRMCKKGEIYKPIENICYVCPKGYYSLNPLDTTCSQCPLHGKCDKGGDSLIIEPGYWRSNENSSQIYKCNSLSSPCLGGYNSTCAEGYTGIICNTCVFNANDKFFKKSVYFCDKCGDLWIYALIIVFALCCVFRFIFFMESDTKQDTNSFVLIKIITTHFQTLNLISNIKLDLPTFLNDFYYFQAPFSTADSLLSIVECLECSFISIYVLKLIFSLILIVLIVLITIIFQMIRAYFKKLTKTIIKIKIITSLIIATSFFQPWLINFYIQNLSCDTYNEIPSLSFNLNQKCYDFTHLLMSLIITIPCLFFLMIAYPLVYFIFT